MDKVGVIQVDGRLPNLALMKISGYHEKIGNSVEWYKPGTSYDDYDLIYASKIFSFSETPELPEGKSYIGGTGIDFYNKLPEDIENHNISYSLYPECNYHIGFSMKGCRFACKFCCVPKKEGRPYNYNSIDEILTNPNGGNRLMLLDNDFFGGTEWKENLERIIELKLKVCFVQGLNIRIITDEQAQLLSKCNYQNSKFNQKYLTFAWDRYYDGKIVKAGIERCNRAGIPSRHMQFFVLIGFNTTHEQNMERVMTLKELGCMPFVMPYNKSDRYQKAFTRWVNFRSVFKSCTWGNYLYNPVNMDERRAAKQAKSELQNHTEKNLFMEEVAEVKKEKRKSPVLTQNRKKVLEYLFKETDGERYFMFFTTNVRGTSVYKIYSQAGTPVRYFHERTVDSQIRDLLKKDDNGRMTINLSKVRELPDNSLVKQYYHAYRDGKLVEDVQMEMSAVIVDNYRYALVRRWDKEKPMVMFIMLNPSTADDKQNDRTINRCIKYARSWGYGGIYVGNLFAFRATNPKELWAAENSNIDKVGPDNDEFLEGMAGESEKIIFAWGTNGRYQSRDDVIIEKFPEALYLKKTKDGFPQHPLFLKGTIIPTEFNKK